jgi:ubiquinone/menaquinone biosynthesis C-methylase UbiE
MITEQDPYLQSFQEAFRPELQKAIRSLYPTKFPSILDCPCGDGFYTQLLANHFTRSNIVAVDYSTDCLERARQNSSASNVEFQQADAYDLPFDDDSFDFVWCAQSFITLEDPVRALRELARVARPGAEIAVLETDEYHHVLLPWPVELELAVYRSLRTECRVRYGTAGKFAQSRRLRAAFLEAGLTPAGRHTIVADRAAPFGQPEREFLTQHLKYLQEFVQPELTPRMLEQLQQESDPDAPESLLNRVDSELTCLATICRAMKPERKTG